MAMLSDSLPLPRLHPVAALSVQLTSMGVLSSRLAVADVDAIIADPNSCCRHAPLPFHVLIVVANILLPSIIEI